MNRRLSYKDVTELINNQFSWLKRKYPLSYYYLETEIRLILNGDSFASEQNQKKYSETSILTIFLLAGYKMVLGTIKLLSGHAGKRSVYLNIARHPELQKKLNKELSERGIKVLGHPPKYLKLFKINKYVPLGPVVNSNFKLQNLHRLIRRGGLPDFLASDKNLEKLEKVLEKHVQSISALLSILGIKYLILQNEHCPHEKILILAGEQIGTKIFIVAHGYFKKSSALVTVAPIRAEELIVWTALQREMLLKETGCNEQKVSFYGWPFETFQWNSKLPDMNPLFILGDIDNDFDQKQFELMIEILKKLIVVHPRLRIRPHPSIKRSDTYRKKLIQTKFDKYIKNETLVEQLRNSNLVTGHDSSVLVQAYYQNIPTYRIKEISTLDIPEVPVITLNKMLSMGVLMPNASVEAHAKINNGVGKVASAISDKIFRI